MKVVSNWLRATRRRRLGAVMAAVGLIGAFGLTACQPNPAQIALKLTLTDTAASGAPAENVTVSVFPAADSSAPATADGITDAKGDVWFTHDGLPAGSYVVRFGSSDGVDNAGQPLDYSSWYNGEADDTAGDRSGAVAITVSDTEPTEVIESYAMTRGSISGWAANAHHATVKAYAVPSGKVVDTIEAGGTTGYFAFEYAHVLPAQNYRISIAKAGYATIFVGSPGDVAYSLADAPTVTAKTGSFFDLGDVYLQSESTITGTVTDGSNPVPGALVAAYVADTNHLATTTRAAADGTFTLHGLSGIGYKLAFFTVGNTYAPIVFGAGAGDTTIADGLAVTPPEGGNRELGSIPLGVGADCAAAQAGSTGSFSGADLHNCDLQGRPLNTTDLSGADLSGANLFNSSLSSSSLNPVDLAGAKLTGTNLSSVVLSGGDLSGVDLSMANLRHTELVDLVWDAETVLPAGWVAVGSYSDGAFVGAGVHLYEVNLSGLDLSGMDLQDTVFASVDLSGADLSGADLSESWWNFVDVSGANLSGAKLAGMYGGNLTWDANTVLPAGWEIVNGSLQQTSP